jgi:hypothetical protein
MGDPVVEECREGCVRRFQVVSESDAKHSIDRQMYLAVDGRLDWPTSTLGEGLS